MYRQQFVPRGPEQESGGKVAGRNRIDYWYDKYKNGDSIYRRQFVLHVNLAGHSSTGPIYATFNGERGMPAIMTIDQWRPGSRLGSPTPTNQRFKAVLFDMGGVLIQYKDPMAYDRLMKKAKKDEQVYKDLHSFDYGDQSVDELRGLVGDIFPGLDLPMHNLIRKLKQAGIKAAVVTNNGFWTPAKNRSVILTDVSKFDLVVESCRVGLRKPDPNIFILAAQRLGVELYECIFVDDTEMHCKSARETGMTAVQAVNCDTATAARQIEMLLGFQEPSHETPVVTSSTADQDNHEEVTNRLTYVNSKPSQGSNVSTFVWESTFA